MNEPNALIAQSLRRKGPNQTADPEGENRSQSPSAGLPSSLASEFSASTSSLRESDVPRQAGRQASIVTLGLLLLLLLLLRRRRRRRNAHPLCN
mmetsp:Transcript_9139/g.18001  ORF Transcript_9139/g.18001 Transcript_9139/m.18001 type:complete len:94 (+) Transcript_9139:60-341(+)